jgi:hypothetical protein
MSKPKSRSPKHPIIGFTKALEYTRKIHSEIPHHDTAVSTAIEYMGFKDSGNARRFLASAVYYGLMKKTATGRVQVTDEGKILCIREDQNHPECLELRAKLPLLPPMIQKAVERWGMDLPPRSTLEEDLRLPPFGLKTDQSVGYFIPALQDSIQVAGEAADSIRANRGVKSGVDVEVDEGVDVGAASGDNGRSAKVQNNGPFASFMEDLAMPISEKGQTHTIPVGKGKVAFLHIPEGVEMSQVAAIIPQWLNVLAIAEGIGVEDTPPPQPKDPEEQVGERLAG